MASFDVAVVGGGIAGVSIGYELSADRRVCVLEQEPTLAFHTTGRSAATFLETYGGPEVRALTTASRDFFVNPPDIVDSPLMAPLGLLWIAPAGRVAALRAMYDEVRTLVPSVRLIDADEAVAINPAVRRDWVELAMVEPEAADLDVHALHQAYVRGLRRRDAQIRTSAGVIGAQRRGGEWVLQLASGDEVSAPVVVNAAGAWADLVAATFGAAPVGIMPLRRCLFTVPAPAGLELNGLPLTSDVDMTFYTKPEGNGFLCSPADEDPQPPGDVKPDELEIARAIDSINDAMLLAIRSVRSSWAGLRSFAPDQVPVVGADPVAEGFFWYAGQGGWGIQMAPALARVGAALLRREPLPSDVASRGLAASALSPARFTG